MLPSKENSCKGGGLFNIVSSIDSVYGWMFYIMKRIEAVEEYTKRLTSIKNDLVVRRTLR